MQISKRRSEIHLSIRSCSSKDLSKTTVTTRDELDRGCRLQRWAKQYIVGCVIPPPGCLWRVHSTYIGQHFFILLCISNLPLARYQLSLPFSRQKRGFKRRNATQWKNGWRGEGGEEASQGKGRRMNDDGSDVKAKLLLAQQQW